MDLQDSSCLVLFAAENSLACSPWGGGQSQKRPENGVCAMQKFWKGSKVVRQRHRSWSGCDAITTPLFAFRHKEPEKEAPKRASTGRRKKADASGQSFPRIRGSEEDRTCPHCSKKFTSVLGCQYHVRKWLYRTVNAVPYFLF